MLQLEGVVCKILNGCQHAGDHIPVLRDGRICYHMLEHQTRLPVYEENLLNLIEQAVEQDNFSEWFPRSEGFHPPLQALPRKALFKDLIEGLNHLPERLSDRFSDGRSNNRKKGVRQSPGIPLNGTLENIFNCGRQGSGELVVLS